MPGKVIGVEPGQGGVLLHHGSDGPRRDGVLGDVTAPADPAEHGTVFDPGCRQPRPQRYNRAGSHTTGHGDLLALALLIGLTALDGDDEALDYLGDMIGHQRSQLGAAASGSEAETEDGPITKTLHVITNVRQHGQHDLGRGGGLSGRGSAMLTTDAAHGSRHDLPAGRCLHPGGPVQHPDSCEPARDGGRLQPLLCLRCCERCNHFGEGRH